MSCNICEDDYGLSWCKNNCSYHMCQDCANKLSECPQCKSSIQINYFFAGKITTIKDIRDGDWNGGWTINMSTRRIVAYDSDIDDDIIINQKCGGLNINKKDIIRYSDYINPSFQLHTQKINSTTNLTGPCIILNKNINPSHGCWGNVIEFNNITNIIDTVNKRNKEMIENCHIFSLEVNKDCDCFRSFVEWGIALEMGKIMILDISPNNIKLKDFYTYASDSIKTFEKLSFYKREAIIRAHPSLNLNYKQYKQHMENIILLKKKDELHFKKISGIITDNENEDNDDDNSLEHIGMYSDDMYGGHMG